MESLEAWQLCEELSVIQAVLLIVGVDPAAWQEKVTSCAPQDRPVNYDATFAAVTYAIDAGRLRATVRKGIRAWQEQLSEDEVLANEFDFMSPIFPLGPDWKNTTIEVNDLRDWLRTRGYESGFFLRLVLQRLTTLNLTTRTIPLSSLQQSVRGKRSGRITL